MIGKVKVFEDPRNPGKIIVRSPRGYESSYVVVTDEKGNRHAIEEAAILRVHRMEYGDRQALDAHRRWARPMAQKKAEELSFQGTLPLSTT